MVNLSVDKNLFVVRSDISVIESCIVRDAERTKLVQKGLLFLVLLAFIVVVCLAWHQASLCDDILYLKLQCSAYEVVNLDISQENEFVRAQMKELQECSSDASQRNLTEQEIWWEVFGFWDRVFLIWSFGNVNIEYCLWIQHLASLR